MSTTGSTTETASSSTGSDLDTELIELSEGSLRATLSSVERPAPPSSWSACMTFGWRAMLKIKHVPMQLFDVTAFPIMMTLTFTYLFGGALAGSPRDYLQQLLPGILSVSIVMITMYTGIAMNTDISKGIFDRFRSLPIWRPSVLVGALLGDAVRYTAASVVILVLGLALGFRPEGGPLGVIAAIALLLVFAFSISWVWTVVGMSVQTQESVMSVSMMIIFPLTFASNVYVDPATMPGWVQAFVDVNPISHLATATRGLMHGDVASSEIIWVLASSAALVLVFAPITMRLFNRER